MAKEELLLTCGSEQGLRYVFDTYVDDGDKVVYPFPTFGMMEVFGYYRKAHAAQQCYNDLLVIDMNAFLDAIDERTALVHFANPDNPTGAAYTWNDVLRILARCEATGTIFLLDEAYFHYYSLPTLDLVREHRNLIIPRSFSKAWGLAGARVGFLVAQEATIQLLRKQKPMDELNSLSLDLCTQVLEKPEILHRNVDQVDKWKRAFRAARSPRQQYVETEGNFIMIRALECARDKEVLEQNGILPRTFSEACLKDCLRISVTCDAIMERILWLLFPAA